jgi:ABC-type Zn uptake system ZnuABC Zn-binding protein ZnuA
MQKLAKADILVVNGLGMEEFLGAPVKKANPNIRVIDSSTGIQETMEYSEGQDYGHDHGHHGHSRAEDHHHAEAHHEHGHHHHHAGVNPHLFASPRMTAKLAMNIAAELSKTDPNGAATYFRNAQTYAVTMNRLADDMAALGRRLKNNRIVQPHGVFDYLARDLGLEIVAVMQAHGQEPSASEMMQLVKIIKEKGAGAIFTEPQYPEKIGKALSKETGAPVAMLDPVATGPENAPLTYYETVMRQNMKTLESTLGVK